jgi:hypothetical protein
MDIKKAKRVMIFIDETDRWHGQSLVTAIVERLRREHCAGATVLRGQSGFGVHSEVHTSTIVDLAVALPILIVVVDEPEVIDRLLPIIEEMVAEGLILVDEVDAIRKRQEGKTKAVAPQAMQDRQVKEEASWTKALMEKLRALGWRR